MGKQIKLITEPTIAVLASQQLEAEGLKELVQWLGEAAPHCLPADWQESAMVGSNFELLFPHNIYRAERGNALLTDNELLVELAGRKCYNSFGEAAGQKTNDGYIANILGAPGKIPHSSVMYHAKMTFFFAGISRRMSHELIRHYVGADRTEEGCPSQESTRYTEHPGHFVVHPRTVEQQAQEGFAYVMQNAYDEYLNYIEVQVNRYKAAHGAEPKGMDRKRIYEAAAMLLPGAAATSMVWTTNPVALQKLFFERTDEAADLEFQRFAKKLQKLCYERWPNLFRESNPAAQR